jgi:hypothetical protein
LPGRKEYIVCLIGRKNYLVVLTVLSLLIPMLTLALILPPTAVAAPDCTWKGPTGQTYTMPNPSSPNGFVDTGGGGCGMVGDCQPANGSASSPPNTAQASAPGRLAFAGSAPGHGPGSLLMLALASRTYQAGCVPSRGDTGGGNPPVDPAPPCPPPPSAPSLPDLRAVAADLALPWPAMQVAVNPWPWGLDGLPSWFWVTGYGGKPLTATTHIHLDGVPNVRAGCPGGPAADADVSVRAVVGNYAWNFGDGRSDSHIATTSLGRPYPTPSDIQHTYQFTANAGYTVTLTAHFALAYQVDGGAWQPLPGIDRTVTTAYRVQQAVPVVVNHA